MEIIKQNQTTIYKTKASDFTYQKIKGGYEVIKINFDFSTIKEFSDIFINVPGFYKKSKVITIGKNVFDNLYDNKDQIKNITWNFHKNNIILKSDKLFNTNNFKDDKHFTFITFLKFNPNSMLNYLNSFLEINPILVLNKNYHIHNLKDNIFKTNHNVFFEINKIIYAKNRFNIYSPISKTIKIKNYYHIKKRKIIHKRNIQDILNYNLLLNKAINNKNYYNKNLFETFNNNNDFKIEAYTLPCLDIFDAPKKHIIVHNLRYKYNNIIDSKHNFRYYNLTLPQIKKLKRIIKNNQNEYEMLVSCIKFCLGNYSHENDAINDKGVRYYLKNKEGVCRHVCDSFARVLQVCGFINKTIMCFNEIQNIDFGNGHTFNAIYLKSLNKWVYLDLTMIKNFKEKDLNIYLKKAFSLFYNGYSYVCFYTGAIFIPANIDYFTYFKNKSDAFFYLGNGMWNNTIKNNIHLNKTIFYEDKDLFTNYALKRMVSLINTKTDKNIVADAGDLDVIVANLNKIKNKKNYAVLNLSYS